MPFHDNKNFGQEKTQHMQDDLHDSLMREVACVTLTLYQVLNEQDLGQRTMGRKEPLNGVDTLILWQCRDHGITQV